MARVEVSTEGEFIAPVVYEYTTNGGSSWELIRKEGVSGKAYIWGFNWQVPNIEASQVQLRITDSLGTTGLSGIFSIRLVPQIKTVRVNNNRFPVPVDRDVMIEWTAVGELSPIDIYYTVDGLATYKIVYELDSSQRSFVWRTPPDPVGDVILYVGAIRGGLVHVGPFEINYTNSVDDESAFSKLAVYPNPASSKLRVKCESSDPRAHATLADVTGRVVYERQVNVQQGEFDLDVSGVLPGNYMLSIASADGKMSRMITISR
jgi:hypothetical protein